MGHVRLHKMTGSEGAAQAQFTGKHASSHNASQSPPVVTGIAGVGPSDAEKVEHRALRLQHGPAANRADFDRRHRDADLKVVVVTRGLATGRMRGESETYFRITVMQLLLSTFCAGS